MSKFDFQYLRESFTYCPEVGILIRKSSGKPAKSMDVHGYIQVGYQKKVYKAHRLIWAIIHGKFPDESIDHINGIRSDNRISNLRIVTKQQNSHNQQQKNKNNKSGFTGVCWSKSTSKWQAGIHVNGSYIYLGVFTTAEEAHLAYLNAKKIHHPSAPANLFVA